MTRDDANELVSNLVSRGRKATDDLVKDLERLLDQARKEVETRTTQARKDLEARRASTAGRPPAAERPRGRRATPPTARWPRPTGCAAAPAFRPGRPITAYDQLTASQIKSRLTDLSRPSCARSAPRRRAARRARASRARSSKQLQLTAYAAPCELGRQRPEVELLAERLGEQLVGAQPLAVAPERAQPLAGLGLGEPALAEALAKRAAPVRLERPGAQVAGDVEAAVDVRQPAARAATGPGSPRRAAPRSGPASRRDPGRGPCSSSS